MNELAHSRGAELLAAHQRGQQRPQHRVEPQLPPDVLGIYVFLPAQEEFR